MGWGVSVGATVRLAQRRRASRRIESLGTRLVTPVSPCKTGGLSPLVNPSPADKRAKTGRIHPEMKLQANPRRAIRVAEITVFSVDPPTSRRVMMWRRRYTALNPSCVQQER